MIIKLREFTIMGRKWEIIEASEKLDYMEISVADSHKLGNEIVSNRFIIAPEKINCMTKEPESSLLINYQTVNKEDKQLVVFNYKGNVFILNDKGQTIERL